MTEKQDMATLSKNAVINDPDDNSVIWVDGKRFIVERVFRINDDNKVVEEPGDTWGKSD